MWRVVSACVSFTLLKSLELVPGSVLLVRLKKEVSFNSVEKEEPADKVEVQIPVVLGRFHGCLAIDQM